MSSTYDPEQTRPTRFNAEVFANALAACAAPDPTQVMLSDLATALESCPSLAHGPACTQCSARLADGARCEAHPAAQPGDLVAAAVGAGNFHATKAIMKKVTNDKEPDGYGGVPLRALVLATRAGTRRPEGAAIVCHLLQTQAAPPTSEALCVVVAGFLAGTASLAQIHEAFKPWFGAAELTAAEKGSSGRVFGWWGVICKGIFHPDTLSAHFAVRRVELEYLANIPRLAPAGGRAPPAGLEEAAETCEGAEHWADARARAAEGPDGREIQKDHAAALSELCAQLRDLDDAVTRLGRFIDVDSAVRAVAALSRLSPPPPEALAFLGRHVAPMKEKSAYRAAHFAFVERMLRRWRGTAELEVAQDAGWEALRVAMWGLFASAPAEYEE